MAIKCPKCLHENPDDTLFCGKCGTQFLSPKDADVTATLETPKEELTRGTALADRYEIIEELGKGGMGRVYRVEDTKLNQEVALKLIKPEIARDKKIIERFRNELKTTRMIAHKNVCRMFDLGEAEGVHFITMEYVRGEDLKSMIRMSGQLGIGTAVNIAKQVCEGLAESHRLGVLHRDLKPSNIMIDRDGNPRIMDFGIARSLESEELTGTGVIIGTPKYVSPEQVEGKEIDRRSDIYSLGIILYEMVTGRVPFEGDLALSIAHKHRYEVPIEPKKINPQTPEDLNQVILKCLEKDRQQRFQSAEDVRDALHTIEQKMPATEREFVDKKPTATKEITVTFALKKLRIPGLIAAMLLIAAVIIWQVLKQGGESQPFESKPSIAVISFDNQTGEETYDRLKKIIPNLLITSLEQSGNFYVVTWERMYDLLKQSGHEDTEDIDRDLGFELCRLDNVDYIVLGSVTKLGDVFATDVKILDVQSKELLRSASARGKNESSILENQIDELSKEISQGIGLSKPRIAASTQKIADVTTSSLDAYSEFLKGVGKFERYYYEEARKFFENAIERDPNFAAAHQWLALTYGNLGDTRAKAEALIKAKALAEKANEKDRLNINALYAQVIEKDVEKRIRILEEMAVKFPREKRIHYNLGIHYWDKKEFSAAIDSYSKALALDPNYGSAWNGLGYTYVDMGNYEKAIESFEKYAAVSPGDANPLDSLAEVYFQIGRLDMSIEKYQEAVDARPDFYQAYWRIAYVNALKQEYRKALAWIGQFIDIAPSSGIKAEAYLWGAFYHYWLGEVNRSLRALRMASEEARRVDNKFGQAYSAWIEGWINFSRGATEKYRSLILSWFELMLKHSLSNRPAPSEQFYSVEYNFFLGLSDLKQGQIDSAKSRLKEIKALMPKVNPIFRKRVVDFEFKIFNTEVLLAEGSLDEAISVFKEEVLLEIPHMNSWIILLYNAPYLGDVLARIYQRKGDLDRAILEYERLITFNPESKERRLIHPLFYYRLAKLYEEIDRGEKAIEHYERFLDLWKNADPGIAEVEDATNRLAGLKGQ